jgi:transcriptional regulator with XRE-family HTH domain
MPKRMVSIREILALNLKKYRHKSGFTQEKLAEKAGISANYLSMVEISRKFPTPEMLDRLAQTLGMQTFQLFDPSVKLDSALQHLEQSIVENVEKVIRINIKQDIISEIDRTVRRAIKQDLVSEIELTVRRAIKQDIVSDIDLTVRKAIKQALSKEIKSQRRGGLSVHAR